MSVAPKMLPVRQEAIDATAAKIAAAEEAVKQAEAWAEEVQVTNAGEATQATQILTTLAANLKQLEGERTEAVKPLNDYVKGVNEKFKRSKAPLETAAKKLKAKVIEFNAAEEDRRREEQERLDAERREAERIIEERRREDAAKLEAEAAAKRAEAEEAIELAAEDSEMEDLADEACSEARAAEARAATIANLPAPALPARQAPGIPKPHGAVPTKRWEAEVTDIRQLPDFLPDGTPLKEVVMSALRRHMFDTLEETGEPPEMPGAKFAQKAGLTVRTS